MCSDGDVRLMNSSGPSTSSGEGRVEVCYNNSYWTVCDDRWDSLDAGVVCRQINITGNGKQEHLFGLKFSYYLYWILKASFLIAQVTSAMFLLQFFLIMSTAMAQRQTSCNVHTMDWEYTTVILLKLQGSVVMVNIILDVSTHIL